MNLSGQSTFNQARIEWGIRLLYSPMPKLTFELISSNLNAFRIGELRVVGKLWETMMERDGELAVNADKRCADLAALEWNIVSDGSGDGDAHAAALTYFYKHLKATHALHQDRTGGVSELLYQMASAHSHFYSAHEILLRIDNADAHEVTAEFRHTPIWFFEARRGYLAYLQHIFDAYGQPCMEGEWLTCIGSGWMRPLSVAYVFKMFALRDWAQFCTRYGSGFLEGVTDSSKGDTAWEEAKEALETMANDGVCLHNQGLTLKFLDNPAKANLPFPQLIEAANGLFAKCYRGVDLATGSRAAGNGNGNGQGGGKNPVGASIQSEESGIFLARDAAWSTGYLNERVDRPLIRYLFGQESRAAIAIMPPIEDTTAEDLAFLSGTVPLGLRIALKDVYKKFNWSAPAAGEPCLEPPAAPAPANADAGADGAAAPAPKRPAAAPVLNAPETTAEAAAATQPAEPLGPIGAGADPRSMPQMPARQMPDPQVNAAGFWSQAGAAFTGAVAATRRAMLGPLSRHTDGTLPTAAYAIPNESDAQAAAPDLSAEFMARAQAQLAQATHDDLAHAAAQIQALLQIDDPEHFKTKAAQLQAKWRQITGNTLLAPSAADALASVIGTAFAQGLQPKEKK